jgi:gliding motility-associated lipoprotein GldD
MLNRIAIFILLPLCAYSCGQKKSTPKPRGYYRIELPKEHTYRKFDIKGYPYSFDVSTLSTVEPDNSKNAEPYWINIEYPAYNAKIYISYKTAGKNLDKLIEDTHYLVYKHTVKSDAIIQQRFEGSDSIGYGYLYEIDGDVASNVQFYITDEKRNFIRGALYFNTHPNRDSLEPVISYITEDIRYLMENLKWKK